VLEYLSKFFDITLYFYNPNITPAAEYAYRAEELERLVSEMGIDGAVKLAVSEYNSDEFYNIARGFEEEVEGGARCARCYRLRLEASARYAAEQGFDFFTTTLSISPYKNSRWLNEIGAELAEVYGVDYLFSDFKKKNGYKRSCELSEQYGLYRQDYCGCEFSRAQRDRKNNH
jgi:predicted adenine nucleotide alpha hydrolase (AANH) superfamily ATPase